MDETKRTGRRRLFRRDRDSTSDAPEQPEVERTRPCLHCGEQVSRGATVCLHCENELVPVMNPAEFAVRFGALPPRGDGEEPQGPPHE